MCYNREKSAKSLVAAPSGKLPMARMIIYIGSLDTGSICNLYGCGERKIKT
jgi:hypothetical protein